MDSVEHFLGKLNEVEEELQGFERGIDDRRQRLMEVVGRIEEAVSIDIDDDKYGRDIRQRVDEIVSQVRKAAKIWRDEIDEQVEQTEFISQFDRSVIVMGFGKVNCGKSTLGNLIAGLPFEGTESNPYADMTAEFSVHEVSEGSGEIETRDLSDGFPTDGMECTEEIQEFTLGGLTWVDSPGIHAMTGSNETLAKKYVDAAELVVYLTSSDKPARASDIEELNGLLDAGKPSLIGVTKFDTTEQYVNQEVMEVETRRVLKSEKARRDQRSMIEEHVEKAGVDQILKDRDYAFISALLAGQAIEDGDNEKFRESGAATFFEQLSEVLSRDAVELKKENPMRNFNRLLKQIWGIKSSDDRQYTTANLKAKLNSSIDQIDAKRHELRGLAELIVTRTVGAATPALRARITKASERLEDGIRDSDLERDLERIICDELESQFARVVARAMRDVMEKVDQLELSTGTWDIPSLEVLSEEIEVSQEVRNERVGGAIGGAVGAAAGSVIGGWGVVVGSIVGTTVGSWIGSGLSGTKTVEARVGTNAEELTATMIQKMESELPELVEANLKRVDSTYFEPLETVIELGVESLDDIENELNELRYNPDDRQIPKHH